MNEQQEHAVVPLGQSIGTTALSGTSPRTTKKTTMTLQSQEILEAPAPVILTTAMGALTGEPTTQPVEHEDNQDCLMQP
jgi:hypothetical protein